VTKAKAKKKAGRGAAAEGPVKVLLAEDEESFIEALVIGLNNEGFRVTVARDGTEALALFEEVEPDIILLDLMLPKMSGIDVCRTIRTRSQVPIIMVTAKGTEIDTVVALEVGADDYVTKPYRLRELVARMRAVLRRAPGGPESSETGSIEFGSDGTWEANGIMVDFDQRRVFVRGDEVHLRRKEFELLRLLVENAGRVLTRDVLIDRVWGTDYIGDTKTLDVHIKRLRSRIEADPSTPILITTVRGVGYRFASSNRTNGRDSAVRLTRVLENGSRRRLLTRPSTAGSPRGSSPRASTWYRPVHQGGSARSACPDAPPEARGRRPLPCGYGDHRAPRCTRAPTRRLRLRAG
jgi:two-component system response regulator RegX3